MIRGDEPIVRRHRYLRAIIEASQGREDKALDIIAQIWHAVETEQACTPADFLLRRSFTGMASCMGLDAVEKVAEEMGKLLGWNESEQQRKADEYRSYISLSQVFRHPVIR